MAAVQRDAALAANLTCASTMRVLSTMASYTDRGAELTKSQLGLGVHSSTAACATSCYDEGMIDKAFATTDSVVCPMCHTVDAAMTAGGIAAGGYWLCTRCGQQWDGHRLATRASYTAYAESVGRPVVAP